MRIVDPVKDKEWHKFAAKAHEHFVKNPKTYSFAEGYPTAGKLLALQWNEFTVMVFMIEDAEEVLLYDILDLKRIDNND